MSAARPDGLWLTGAMLEAPDDPLPDPEAPDVEPEDEPEVPGVLDVLELEFELPLLQAATVSVNDSRLAAASVDRRTIMTRIPLDTGAQPQAAPPPVSVRHGARHGEQARGIRAERLIRLTVVSDQLAPNDEFTLRSMTVPAGSGATIVVHGGAGAQPWTLAEGQRERVREGLQAAVGAGQAVLAAGGSAADAVCAAVHELEDNEMFNAGRGACLTSSGTVEMDACLMLGNAQTGAVTECTSARNPIDAARAVMERTPHVLLINPSAELLGEWGIAQESPDYFVTERQQQALARVRRTHEISHGTVGAVARDRAGHVAAATSTGGMTNKMVGRVGDTPIPGAGSFAADGLVTVSGTGEGEFFIRGALAHDISARMKYAGADLADAVGASIEELLTDRRGTGGVIAIDDAGQAVIAYNSEAMYWGHAQDEGEITIGW